MEWLWAVRASGIWREEKARSCFWRTSLAAAAEEMTRTEIRPSFKNMIGPCIAASLARDWCGWSPSKWRFPMIGNGVGPGGRFLGLPT